VLVGRLRCAGAMRRIVVAGRIVVNVLALALASVVLPAVAHALVGHAVPSATTGQDAVTFQMTPGHTGASMDPVGPQWTSSWTTTLSGPVSYPLVADGDIFVVDDPATPSTNATPSIDAFNASTGAGLWQVTPVGGSTGLAFDDGRIFSTSDDTMDAYDALTGGVDWSTTVPDGGIVVAAPTAADGMVFANGDDTLYAFSQSTGALVWASPTAGGDSSPAVGADGVYVSGGCDVTQAFDPTFGAHQWTYDDGCEGGDGPTPVVADGNVYLRDLVLDASTGAVVSSLVTYPAPAVDHANVYLENGGILQAQTAANGAVLWSFPGDYHLDTAPIEDNGVVYEGSSTGEVFGVSAATGQMLWSTNVGTAVGPTYGGDSFWGMAEGDDLLVVPAGNTLTVFDDPFTAPAAPTGVTATVGAGQAVVRWTVPADNGSPIVSFTISASVDGVAQTPVVVAAGKVGSATDATPGAHDRDTVSLPADGSSPVVTVAADNGGGEGAATTAPYAPAIVSAPSAAFGLGESGSFTVRATGVPVPSLGETGPLPAGVSFTDNGDGTATVAGTAATGTLGTYPVTITADNGEGPAATQNFVLSISPAVVITSAAATTFTTGGAGSFTFEATGSPAPTFTETGPLPPGVSLGPDGTLAGTPPPGAAGTYPLAVTASNGSVPDATENFVLTVNSAPLLTSVPSTAFPVGQVDTFTVTATGDPTPSLQESGALPTGVTFTDNGDGTATVVGTPSAAALGPYPLTFTATNGVGVPAQQAFLLTVGQAPAITSRASATFTVGAAGSFSVQGSGSPTPAFSETGPLPAGVTLSDDGTLAGTPAPGTDGTYPITMVAANGVVASATQSFILTVDDVPAITSGATVQFVEGSADSFTVTTSGFPLSSLSESGALPAGVRFSDNGDGTGRLAGTAAVGAHGSYPITLTATNGVTPQATQNLVLTVAAPPVVTSAAATTFTVGSPGTFTFQWSGFPTPTLSVSGPVPAGVTVDADGTGLEGTPQPGSAGTYRLTVFAFNGVQPAPQATQTFVLTVDSAPTITSADSAAFATGQPASFLVTTTGVPDATLQESGVLPTGVTFTDDDDGSATMAGTPGPGTSGSYPVTITAGNGVGSPATQSFVLTVFQPLTMTSPASAVFTALSPGSFVFATDGSPPATFSEAGPLPAGVTLAPDGTLSGTPAPGSQGVYRISVTATNAVVPAITQSFTLEVGLLITTSSLPEGVSGPYRATLAVVGGDAPYHWTVAGGTLPKGLHLNGTTGVIAGTVKRSSASSTFTVRVTDADAKTKPHDHATATAVLTLTIS
jgi:outer membrane protein assembly factor BamB